MGHKKQITRLICILDEEEDSDPDVDMVSVLPSLWFYWGGLMASMQESINTIFF